MRDYSKVSPKFWIGKTGKALRRNGTEAVIVGMYLMTSPTANMLGLYYLTIGTIAHETGLGFEGASKGLKRCIEAGFCSYDEDSEVAWVYEMASYQIAEALEPKDNRCKGVQNEYDGLPDNPYLAPFFDKYAAAFNMTKKRGESEINAITLQAPSKPLASQEQEQKQEQDQEQKQDAPAPVAPAAPKKSRAPAKTPLPDGFCISERVKAWAEEKCYSNIDRHFENFVSACRAKGYTYVDWDEGFMGAVRNDWAKLGSSPQARASPSSHPTLGKAGQATAANLQRWLEESDATN